MGFCPFFFRRKTKIMLNQRSDKVELLRIAEAVAMEKSIDKEIILSSMESAIQKAAKTKFGSENDIRAKIDRESGDISLHKVLTIVEKQENFNNEISVSKFSGFSTIVSTLRRLISPLSRSILALISFSEPNLVFAAFCIADSIELKIISLSIDFSLATASAILKSSTLSDL